MEAAAAEASVAAMLRTENNALRAQLEGLGARPDAEGLGEDADDYPDELPAAAAGGGGSAPPAKRGRGPARGGSGD
jgi:hypothetical protein